MDEKTRPNGGRTPREDRSEADEASEEHGYHDEYFEVEQPSDSEEEEESYADREWDVEEPRRL